MVVSPDLDSTDPLQTDNMKNLTEKIKNNSAAVLVPNPGERKIIK